jgi:hypothetical protein
MRKETAFCRGLRQDPDFFAFYRSMQAYETGLEGSDTRMVMSPKSDFFLFFGTPMVSHARRGYAVCSPLAHDPHKSDHARCAAAALGSILRKRDPVEADGILGHAGAGRDQPVHNFYGIFISGAVEQPRIYMRHSRYSNKASSIFRRSRHRFAGKLRWKDLQ